MLSRIIVARIFKIIIMKSFLFVGGLIICDDMVVVDVKIFSNVFII